MNPTTCNPRIDPPSPPAIWDPNSSPSKWQIHSTTLPAPIQVASVIDSSSNTKQQLIFHTPRATTPSAGTTPPASSRILSPTNGRLREPDTKTPKPNCESTPATAAVKAEVKTILPRDTEPIPTIQEQIKTLKIQRNASERELLLLFGSICLYKTEIKTSLCNNGCSLCRKTFINDKHRQRCMERFNIRLNDIKRKITLSPSTAMRKHCNAKLNDLLGYDQSTNFKKSTEWSTSRLKIGAINALKIQKVSSLKKKTCVVCHRSIEQQELTKFLLDIDREIQSIRTTKQVHPPHQATQQAVPHQSSAPPQEACVLDRHINAAQSSSASPRVYSPASSSSIPRHKAFKRRKSIENLDIPTAKRIRV